MKNFSPTQFPMHKSMGRTMCKLAKSWCLATLLFSQVGFACDDVIFSNGFDNTFTLSVDVIALGNNTAGRTLELQLNNNETLSLSTDGLSSFCTQLPANSSYQVAVTAQPQSGNACVLSSDSGTLTADTIITANCGDSRWDEMNWDENNWN